jgi:hypothetical protein
MADSRSASSKTMFGDLPPSSSDTFFKLSAAAYNELANFRRAGECNLVDPGMGRESRTGSFTKAGHNVHDTIRNSRLLDQLPESERRKWSLLGWLQHDSATGGKGRAEFPRRHEQWKVPRNDLANDTDRLPLGVERCLNLAFYTTDRSALRIHSDLDSEAFSIGARIRWYSSLEKRACTRISLSFAFGTFGLPIFLLIKHYVLRK